MSACLDSMVTVSKTMIFNMWIYYSRAVACLLLGKKYSWICLLLSYVNGVYICTVPQIIFSFLICHFRFLSLHIKPVYYRRASFLWQVFMWQVLFAGLHVRATLTIFSMTSALVIEKMSKYKFCSSVWVNKENLSK
jgi:hypothetical protein